MNGTFDKTLLIGPCDDIYVSFEDYTYIQCSYQESSKIHQIYCDNQNSSNVVIDDRLIVPICYLSFYYDDILIYNTKTTSVETLIQFIMNRIIQSKLKYCPYNRAIQILYIYVFTRYLCKNCPFQWNLSYAIQASENKKIQSHAINLIVLIDYFNLLRTYSYNKTSGKILPIIDILTFKYPTFSGTTFDVMFNIIELYKNKHTLVISG